jgi:hypothetical protein
MTQIEITREKGWADRARAYSVWVDGGKIGEIRAGETRSFSVRPGPHTVRLRIDWCGSRTLEILAGDEPVVLRCKHGVFPGLQILALIFTPSRWIDLRVVDAETP